MKKIRLPLAAMACTLGLFALITTSHAQERVSQDPHDSVRATNSTYIDNSGAINDCVSNTQSAAAEACPVACQIRVPNAPLSKADSCDSRVWTCQWPQQTVAVSESCPAGWNGSLSVEKIYELQNCGQNMADTGKYNITGSACTRDRTEVSQTACPTQGGWTGAGVTKSRTVHELLDKDLSTTTVVSTSAWTAVSIDCRRVVEKEKYFFCPIGSGNTCEKLYLQTPRKEISATCPADTSNANMEVTVITQRLAKDLVTAIDDIVGTPSPTTLVCPAVDGVCGSTTHGQTLTKAPSGNELCTTGDPTAVKGKGPWTWTCRSPNGGKDSQLCEAKVTKRPCPPIVAWHHPLAYGTLYVSYAGLSTQEVIYADPNTNWINRSYLEKKCSHGKSVQEAGGGWSGYNHFVACIANEYMRIKFDGYGETKDCPITNYATSPLKVNLKGEDAKLNSTKETKFILTLKDGRILEGNVTGGLNPDEGWLMVHRTAAGLLTKEGALNADNWFGDRDHRSINGYTDLAETFAKFVETDQYGKRYIALRKLTDAQKKEKVTPGVFSNPSFDLRIIDASNNEHFASDYFLRIYVDYTDTMESDGNGGAMGNNMILERGLVQTLKGEFRGAVDHWFMLDLPASYNIPEGTVTRSKVRPGPSPTAPAPVTPTR